MITRGLGRFAAELNDRDIAIVPGTVTTWRKRGWRPRYTVAWVQRRDGSEESRFVTIWWAGNAIRLVGQLSLVAGAQAA